ncbi:hypothetical protein RDABS01_036627 [Bienertia sinuspersici]
MEIYCDLEVDVNGQHIFWVNKKILAKFSSKLSNLFENKHIDDRKGMKVIFQDFPGGAASFELITRFIYNDGIIDISHSNVLFLNQVAKYMEMNKNVFGRPNLTDQTEKFLEGIDFWTWSELLEALTHGQCLLAGVHPVSSIVRLVGEVVERVASRCLTTPSSLSSKCSSFRSSCDSKSTLSSTKSSYFQLYWWFEDLSTFNVNLIDMLVKKMVLEKFDHLTISKFLFYYQRVKVHYGVSSKVFSAKIVENIINLLSLLNKRSISIKGLFETLRVASNLKIKKPYKSQLELLIGLQLDQATLDDLILPSPPRKNKFCTMYNVNRVMRFLKNFLLDGNVSHKLCSYRLKKVARLVDLYASEIAPEPRLKPSKFVALISVIPESARDSYDKIYQAIEIYLEVHPRIGEEQKMNICAALNFNKLSTRVLYRLSRNANFPLLAIVKALAHQNPTLKSSVKNQNHLKIFKHLGCRGHEGKACLPRDEVLVKELKKNNDMFRVYLQDMGWTVAELEHIFGKLQSHYVKNNVINPKMCCIRNVKHLPKLCS